MAGAWGDQRGIQGWAADVMSDNPCESKILYCKARVPTLTSQGFPLPPLLIACRPRQWPKNLLVFAAPLFAFRSEPELWLRATVALVAFCLISSGIYLINDCLDVAADRAHPSKCRRPIAAGLVSVPAALASATLLAAASLSLAASISMALAAVVLLYGLIQLG
jgi:decaprenyl-phosphate phosphoribosyltransferase